MFWNNSKPKKDSYSTAIVRQDPRTTVKTSTAQSETTSRSVQNDTIFNSNNNTVAFRTTTQTITHQQKARITEICKRYTPTPEELAEMRAEIFSKSETTTTSSRGKPAKLPAIDYKSFSYGVGAVNKSPKSPLIFSYDDSPRAYSSSTKTTTTGGYGKPTTPTIGKVQKTVVTQKEGRTMTSTLEQQRVKLGVSSGGASKAFNFSTPQTTRRLPALTNNMTTKFDDMRLMPDAKPFVLSSPNSPLTTKLLPTSNGSTAFGGGSSVYQSPYLKRTIITSTTTTSPSSTKSPNTTASTRPQPTGSAKITTNTKLNWLNPPTISVAAPTSNVGSTSHSYLLSSTPSASKLPANNKVQQPSVIKPAVFASSTVSSKKKSKLQPGYAYIFNNEVFDNPSNEYRVGSSIDVKQLRKTFEEFKLKVNVIENATLDKIASTVKKIETKDYSNNSCIVIVILSHGTRYEEVSAKDGTYSIDDKILFPILRNRTLNDKPKIMFIQACKGAMEIGGFHKDAVQPHGSPNEIFKCYSTFEGYVSYRTENGSIFIQTVCEFLKMFGSIKNIKEIMEMVNLQVKQKSESRQIPAILSTLSKPYVFGDYV